MFRRLSPVTLVLFALAAKAAPLTIQTNSLPNGEVNAYYNQTIQVSGGVPSYTWSLLSGNLPAGLSLNPTTGAITGSPTTQAQYTFTIQVMDATGEPASQTYTNVTIFSQISINYTPPLAGMYATLPNGAFADSYSQTLTTSGGNGALTWSVVSGSLPNSVTINNSTGVISGTPTPPQGFPPNTALQVNVEIGVTDAFGGSATQYFAFLVNPALSISTTIVPVAVNGVAYSTTLAASGGSGQFTWSVPANSLPSGFSLNPSTGVISGNPVLISTGTFPLTVTVNDSNGGTAQQSLSLAVDFPGKVITTNLLPGMAIVNIGATTDGAENYNSGQTIWYQPFNQNSPSQLLEYTVQPGTYTFRVIDPADALGIFPSLTGAQFTSIFTSWTFNSPWATAYLVFPSSAATNSSVGQLFSGAEFPADAPSFTGGGATQNAYNYAVANGLYDELFVGERNAPNPVKQYTFATEQTLIFAVPDYDLGDNAGGVSVLIAPLASQPLSVTGSALPSGQAGLTYGPYAAANIPGASGGSGIYQWELSPNSSTQLPSGLQFSSGLLTGIPTVMGTFSNILLRVTDPVSGIFAEASYSITIAAPANPLTITTTSPLPSAHLNAAYQVSGLSFTATGGLGNYTWSMTNVGPASGLTMSAAGLLSGTITTPGTYAFNVTVQDTAGDQTTQQFSVSAIGITTTTLPGGTLGESYSVNLSVAGAAGNVNWIVEGGLGTPPAGITLSNSGTLAGIPTTIGPTSFTVKATDATQNIAIAQLSLTISGTTQISYAVLNESTGGLVTVSSDGTQVNSLAPSVNGTDLTLDASGNFIAAAVGSLIRVTPAGTSSTISTAPSGSQWIAVAVDGTGNLIVGDNEQHKIWRITPDGATVTPVATYPVTNQDELESVHLMVDVNGNYIVAHGNGGGAHLFSITPAGVVTAIALTGSPLPTSAGSLAFDPHGNYILQDYSQGELFTISPAGNTSLFATGTGFLGLARNPVTNNYITGVSGGVLDISANGSTSSSLAQSASSFSNPQGIVVLTSDFVTTVDATNPLAYFRLQGASGVSETNVLYTYSLSATGATTSSPGAPVGEAGENYALLNGTSGDITTNLSGTITTAGSLMAWINLAALPSTGSEAFEYLVGESQEGNDFDLQFSNSNVLGFYTTNNGQFLSYTPNPATLVGQWHMVVATFDANASTRAIYWDGALVASDNSESITDKSGIFEIGESSVFTPRFFDGGIGEAAIWNYALTPAQVYGMFASSAGNFESGNSPTISSITPSSTLANGAALPITINGFNLANTSAIWWTPVSPAAQTTVVPATFSEGGVTATIPATLFTAAGTFQIAAANAAGVPSNEMPFTVIGSDSPSPALSISTTSLTPADQNLPYSQTVSASGGSGNYSWSIVSQSAGLNFSIDPPSGLLTGTPSISNTSPGLSIQIMVTDTVTMLTQTQTYSVIVYPALSITTTSLSNATLYQTYMTPITATGGSGSYSWSVSNQSDALSVTINGSGTLCVTPRILNTNPGFSIQVTVTDTVTGESQSQTYNLIVSPPPQPAGTTVYVLDSYGDLTSVTAGGASNEFAYVSDGECECYDMTRDASGDFIVAMGSQGLEVVGPSGALLSQISPSQLLLPEGSFFSSVAVDSSGFYIVADAGLNQLYRIAPDASSITDIGSWTFPGTEDQRITNSTDAFVKIDSSGRYIVSTDYQAEDSDNVSFQLFVVNAGTTAGVFTPLALTGETLPQSTSGFTFDANGNYVDVDWWNDLIYTIQPNGAVSELFSDPNEVLSLPGGISRDPASGDFFLADYDNNALYTLTPNGSQLTLISQNGFYSPVATLVADTVPAGAIDYVLTNPDAINIVPVGGAGNTITCTDCDYGIDFATDAQGNFIVATGDQLVKVTSPAGACPTGCTILSATGNQYFFSVAVDNTGNYIVADNGDHQILKIVPGEGNTGTVAAAITYTVNEPEDDCACEDVAVRIDSAGNYVVAEDNDDDTPISIFRIAPNALGSPSMPPTANPITLTPVTPLESIPVTDIGGLTLDSNGNYVITDDDSGQIYTVTPAGAFGILFNNANQALSYPAGIYLDPVSGNYLITDYEDGNLLSMNQTGSQINLIASGLYEGTSVLSYTPSLTVTTFSLPGGTVGQPYSAILEAEGGSGNYNWTSTALPAGLTLSASGVISGTPSATTPATVTFTVTDTSNSGTAMQTYSLAIAAAVYQPLMITTTSLPAGTTGQAYTTTMLTATGGSGSYTWSATGVPNGLTVSAMGSVSGTPTVAGGFANFTVTVTDTVTSATMMQALPVTIAAGPLSISTTALPGGVLNVPYGPFSMTPSGGSGSFSWSVAGQPAGLLMSAAGILSGTPTASGTTPQVMVTLKDTVSQTSVNATLPMTVGPLTISYPNFPPNPVEDSTPIAGLILDGSAAQATSVADGQVVRLTSSAANQSGGAFTNPGIALENNSADSFSTFFQFRITNPAATGPAIGFTFELGPAGGNRSAVGVAFATNASGVPPNTAGILVSPNENLLDTAPIYGTSAACSSPLGVPGCIANGDLWSAWIDYDGTNLHVAVADNSTVRPADLISYPVPLPTLFGTNNILAGFAAATKANYETVDIVDWQFDNTYHPIVPPAITTSSLPTGTQSSSYGPVTLGINGGFGTFTWSATGLPGGLTLSPGGVLSGTPMAAGTSTGVTITATDTTSQLAVSKTYTLTIASPVQPLTISTASLPNGSVNTAYGPVALIANGGSGNYLWSVSGVAGLTVNSSTGVLGGIPTTAGPNQALTVTVTDTTFGEVAQTSLPVTITPALSITTTALPNGTQNQPYSGTLAATGGSGNYRWAVSGIAGLTVNPSTGAITGSPTSGGTQTLTATVTDTVIPNSTATQTYSVGIAFTPLMITGSSALGGFAPGATVSASFGANGGQPTYTWSAPSAPSGINVNPSSGQLSGTAPQQPGNYSFSLTVTDSEKQAASASVTVTFSVLGFTTGSTLPSGTTATAYSANISAVGGTPPYSFTGSGVPPGLTLASSGFLSGTPTSANTFNLAIQVSDSTGLSVSGSFALTIATGAQPIQVTGGQLPNGSLGTPYSQTLEAEDGNPSYTWSILGGNLPAGLSLSSSGAIVGTPTGTGMATFTARATDSSGGFASNVFTIMVNPAPLQITSASLPGAIEGSNYPPQTINATGGVQPYTFTLTEGSLPSPLTFLNGQISGGIPTATGTFSFGVTVTDANGSTSTGSYSIKVAAPGPGLLFSAGSVSFSLVANATALPPPASVPIASSVSTPLSYTFAVSPAAAWLDVSGGGMTPGAMNVSLDPSASSLSPGNYQTTITVTCTTSGPCSGSTNTISVSLAVSSPPPQLSVGTILLSFSSAGTTAQTLSQPLNLQNVGGGTITIDSVTAADPWITFGTIPATLSAGQLIPVTVNADVAGLESNYYTSTITVTSSAGSINIPVSLLVSTSATMTLNPAGSQFLAVAGNPPGNSSGSFVVSVSGNSAVTWTAAVTSAVPWLTLNTTSGSSTSTNPGSISFSINSAAASLAANAYYATIEVTASGGGVIDPVQDYEVVLNVAPAASAAQPDIEPAGLIFIGSAGTLPPQTVQVFASSMTAVTYNALASSTGNWLTVSPASGTASSDSPGQSSVSVNLSGLTAGVHYGSVSYSFSSEVRTVNVTLIIPKTAAAPAISSLGKKPNATPGCTPSQIVPTATGLVNNFSLPTAWPTPLTIRLLDDCGAAITNGQVVATFTNGDPPLALGPVDSVTGNYSGTWTPRATASQLTISANATAPSLPTARIQIAGEVTRNAAPVLAQNGTFNAFIPVPGSPLAPGMIVQIYGSNLAAQAASATTIPLVTSLGNTSVVIGGVQAPLYYVSPGQINAQVPTSLAPGNAYQVIVNANGSLSTPNPIQLAQDSPGIAAFASGAIIAQHENGSLVTESSPAAPGEYIVFYVAGMGPTNVTVASGGPSPSSPLATPLDPPTLTLNGSTIPISFAGLTPTLVGLYQVNFQVPANTPNGDLQLVLTQTGGQSNMTVLPVHN